MTKFGQKFCSKHPLKQRGDTVSGGMGNQAGKIKPINPPQNPDQSLMEKIIAPDFDRSDTMLGSSGAFGLIGSGLGSIVKGATYVAKNPKVIANTLSAGRSALGAIKNFFSGGTKARSTGGFKPLVTGGKTWDKKSINEAFESRFGPPPPPKNNPNKLTGGFFEAPKQYMKKATNPPNYKKHVA